jgi:hypothetical protein
MTAYPSQTQTGPIVHHPTGLPITARYDAAWIRTRDCSALDRCATQEPDETEEYFCL